MVRVGGKGVATFGENVKTQLGFGFGQCWEIL